MLSLLNRFAWFISILFGIILSMLFVIGDYYSFSEEGFFIIFLGIIIGTIFKNIFFSFTSLEEVVGIISPASTREIVDDHGSMISEIVAEAKRSDPSMENTQYVAADSEGPIVVESVFVSEPIIPEEPSVLSLWIHGFFADRPLAKIGGILLFLGALFFLGLIFVSIGPVGRVLMGILFGFFLVGVGVWLDAKDIKTESRVLFGIGIAVNYLTILFGRHLLSGGDLLISDSLATFALLLNTVFAIVLALVYRSRVLLGFAFILAYFTPFLVGTETSSVILLVVYTTLITVGISIINLLYARIQASDNIEYLEWIAVLGMTALFSIASFSSTDDLIYVFVGLGISVGTLSLISYKEKKSPVAIFIAAFVVLMMGSFGGSSIFLLPFCIISLLVLSLFFVLQNLITIFSLMWFGIISFVLGLFAFWTGGSMDLSLLFLIGVSIFIILGYASLKLASYLLSSVAVIGFALLISLGVFTLDIPLESSPNAVILVKSMSILLLIGASIFTIRLRDAIVFFLAILMSGLLMIYPDTFTSNLSLTIVSYLIYIFISLLIPYILIRGEKTILHLELLLASLVLSVLVTAYGIYQFGSENFPGIGMGVAYIIQAIVYLGYAIMMGSGFLSKNTGVNSIPEEKNKNILLVLFAVPLSLFTFSLAFLFRDTPGVMSLAWILESTILYLVAIRMNDSRIFTGANFIFLIGVIKGVTLMNTIEHGDYSMLVILILMLVAIFSSLIILKSEKRDIRLPYDIIHVLAILVIGYGLSRVIPSTGHGWSLLAPAVLILILEYTYTKYGHKIHYIFLNFIFGLLCLSFIINFDSIDHAIPYFFIQMGALTIIALMGYQGFFSKNIGGFVNMGISAIGFLWISSLYINEFAGIFAVSIYLTIVASFLIIRGIALDNPRIRTIGLYIGIFVLAKILFYDIWAGNSGTITRVLALMIAGGVMIYLSQLYGKYVSRGWSLELSVSNILDNIGNHKNPSMEANIIEDTNINIEINPFIGELHSELKNVDVSDYSAVILITRSGEEFTFKRSSVMKLAKHISTRLNKVEFKANELGSAYQYVLKNMMSVLPEKELQSLLTKIQKWISEGGKIVFIQKNK